MDIATINRTLHRPLQSGSKFNADFKKSSCEKVKLASGNTKVAIEEMARWAKKYQHHTKKHAARYKKMPLNKLSGAIHQFLYNNIQYKLDEYDQNLKSPSCSWQTRSEGTDCKSYSIFASTILLNLGVKHYLRRVRQPNIYEDAYTHVYVVIPEDQKNGNLNKGYYIVDATLKVNKEVPFIEKKDLYMEPTLPIYGLAAPGVSTYSDKISVAWNQFEDFLTTLSAYSESNYSISQLRYAMRNYLSAGIIPDIRITENGIYLNDQFFNLKTTFRNLAKSQGAVLNGSLGAAVATTSIVSGLLDKFKNTLGLDLKQSISNVLKYGLNSFNSSSDPDEIQIELNYYANELDEWAKSLTNSNAQEIVNKLSRRIEWGVQFFEYQRAHNARANSTKAAYDAAKKFFYSAESAFNSLLAGLRQNGFTITELSKKRDENFQIYRAGVDWSKVITFATTYTTYKVVAPSVVKDVVNTVTGGVKDVVTTYVPTSNNNQQVPVTYVDNQQTGSNNGSESGTDSKQSNAGGYLLGALALGSIIYAVSNKNKKKEKSSN
ncbi:hypothetical protein [Abyssalbus ytuae]|uniref:Transglutaminase-like domain-containing protein n=1 Tax=Abyssalbus ytuae TaxID=2926907 RepID=A0A9E7D473_9FLAO|nr:hypothetical protein [Abyssalbus ytuae]UOB18594.1 hypothetical protein MQE35_04720 [Abyssalbus ytuae]